MKKLLVMGLALAFVLTMGVGIMAHPDTSAPWYINTTAVYWNGSDILAEIDQLPTTVNSEAFITQSNNNSYNYAGIGQRGTDLYAEINQDATRSFVRVSQGANGIGNSAVVDQFGDLNRVRTVQHGMDNTLEVYQAEGSYFNYARILQDAGLDNFASIDQWGSRNGAFIYQDGDDMIATISQDGSDNDARIHQYGM